jgi:hypothetical protein
MIKCPKCQSLVPDEERVCPSCRFDLDQYRKVASLSPASTVALTAAQIRELVENPPEGTVLPQPAPSPPPPPPSPPAAPSPAAVVPPTHAVPVPPRTGMVALARQANAPARAAYVLAFFSVLPVVSLLALICGLVGLSQTQDDADPSRGKALVGIWAGVVFTALWCGLAWWFFGRP